MRRLIWLPVFLLLGLLPVAAKAQTCTYSSSNLTFGVIVANPTPQTDTTDTITVTCAGTVGQTVRVCLGIPAGAGTGSTLADRRMSTATDFVQYQIYQDAARIQIWGLVNQALTPFTLDIPIVTATGNVGTATGYGRVFAGQIKPAGNYLSAFTVIPNRGEGRIGYVVSPVNPNCATFAGVLTRFSFTAAVGLGAVCTVVASDISFGTTTTLASLINATGTVQANCTLGAAYTIAMNGGSTTGNIANRRMAKVGAGANSIGYQLYRNSARTTIWGDGVTGTVSPGTGTGANQNITVYARVPAQATPPVDDYQDTITVTMTY